MLYLAAVFWMCVVVLSASGVYFLWTGMVKARIVNIVLLPGTLAAQLGHVLGMLVTGGTVEGTSLISDDESASPKQSASGKPRIPVVGPLIVGVLPLLTCAGGIVLSTLLLGGPSVNDLVVGEVLRNVPVGVPAFWDLLHNLIDLMEQMLIVAGHAGGANWQVWLFMYLLVCLTVRMAPLPGNLRGALAAIATFGLIAFLAGLVFAPTRGLVERGWSMLSLTVITLMLLLVISALIRGAVALGRVILNRPGSV
ncbi:MAG: hypothetical protein DHS20C16_10080 [Phycisphaerae bacterium]|nr:MAG: hypothetical protein DHS20C16_10080 [Phycisphaerae bacterium]